MLKALWFFIKLAVLLAAVVWLVERPGVVVIDWQDYVIEMSVGVLVAGIAIVCLFFTWGYRFWCAFISVPSAIRRYRVVQAREQGYSAVTKGLVAIAAGDAVGAKKHALRAQNLLPDTSLTHLLKAQSDLMNGDIANAHIGFNALLEDKDAAFFGLRGLLNQALKENDDEKALELIEKAEKLHPKRDWILLTRFSIETRLRKWNEADQTLSKAMRHGTIDREIGNSHRQAILLARSERNVQRGMASAALGFAKKAFRLDKAFVPASLQLARLYLETNKQRSAIKIIEQTWVLNPHMSLAKIWMELIPSPRKMFSSDDTVSQRYKWAEKLYKLSPHDQASNQILGQVAFETKMWDKARECLKNAGDYKALAELEAQESNNEDAVRAWLEMAVEAPPKSQWVCQDCGYVGGDTWSVSCQNCQGFNTFDWQSPQMTTYIEKLLPIPTLTEDIIEPPLG